MSGSVRGSKTVTSNSPRGTNNSNLTDLNNKVQNTYLLEAMVSEIRPSGDVILATVNGPLRSSSSMKLSQGDKVTARISNMENGEIKAKIISVDSLEPTQVRQNKGESILMKYLGALLSTTKTNIPEDNGIFAKFSYVSPSRNILKYGHINPGDSIKIQIIPHASGKHQVDVISCAVIGNEHGVLSVNSPLGIINIETDSDFQPSQKILLKIIDTPPHQELEKAKNYVLDFMKEVSSNMPVLKQILLANRNISDAESYARLIQLVTTQHDGATLAKLFHQTRNIPDSEIERWIDEEIVEPFEASSKGNKLTNLSKKITEINSLIKQMRLYPESEWSFVPIEVSQNKQPPANLKIKNVANILYFSTEINHSDFGQVVLEGTIELYGKNKNISSMAFNIKHTDRFPKALLKSISSVFTEHRNMANIEGSIDFINLAEV